MITSKSSASNNLQTKNVLIVEDERDLADLLALNLGRAGYRTLIAADGLRALSMAAAHKPDLIILDVMLPGLSGTEVAARLRSDPAHARTPIVMLTARAEEVDQLVGLAVGADDYITKPFSVKVLLARLEALLRRTAAAPADAAALLRLGPVEVNPATHEVRAGSGAVRLTLTEFRVLSALIKAGGRILSRQELVTKAIGPGITVTDRTIDVHMTALRKKLGEHGALIHTVRGVGYRADEKPEPA
ncbi:MAG: response regulator transcription factor [Phycisphaerales bacterium]